MSGSLLCVSKEVAALLLIVAVHVVGAVALVWALVGEDGIDWRSLWPRDDDDGHGGDPGTAPRPPFDPDGLPLPDAARAPVRLREPGRLADLRSSRHERRPAHAPGPAREPDRDSA